MKKSDSEQAQPPKKVEDERSPEEEALRIEFSEQVRRAKRAEQVQPNRQWRCESCGETLEESEVDGVRGHCRAVCNAQGEAEPAHCGPCSPILSAELQADERVEVITRGPDRVPRWKKK